MVRLIDLHGEEIIRHGKNTYYSPEFKEAAIKRVLVEGKSALSVSLELGLTSKSFIHTIKTIASLYRLILDLWYYLREERSSRNVCIA